MNKKQIKNNVYGTEDKKENQGGSWLSGNEKKDYAEAFTLHYKIPILCILILKRTSSSLATG